MSRQGRSIAAMNAGSKTAATPSAFTRCLSTANSIGLFGPCPPIGPPAMSVHRAFISQPLHAPLVLGRGRIDAEHPGLPVWLLHHNWNWRFSATLIRECGECSATTASFAHGQFSDSQKLNNGITDGATEKVTPIHSPAATVVSTATLAVLVWSTHVSLAAVATAPPEDHLPVQMTLEFAPAATPIDRKTSQHS